MAVAMLAMVALAQSGENIHGDFWVYVGLKSSDTSIV